MDSAGDDLGSDGSANMCEEWIAGKMVAYSEETHDLVAVDSGCNRLVLLEIPTSEECPVMTYFRPPL